MIGRLRLSTLSVAVLGPLAAFVGYSAAHGERRVIAYLVVWSFLAALVLAAHRRWPLSRPTLWALTAAGWIHLAGGLLPSPTAGAPILYETWLVPGVLKFDQLAHASISAVVTVAVFGLLGHVLDEEQAGPTLRATLAVLVCGGFGAGNELFEFLSALRFTDAYVGGLDNAGWDLAFNTIGSIAAGIACVATSQPASSASSSARAASRSSTRMA